jgi:hypothetical protein
VSVYAVSVFAPVEALGEGPGMPSASRQCQLQASCTTGGHGWMHHDVMRNAHHMLCMTASCPCHSCIDRHCIPHILCSATTHPDFPDKDSIPFFQEHGKKEHSNACSCPLQFPPCTLHITRHTPVGVSEVRRWEPGASVVPRAGVQLQMDRPSAIRVDDLRCFQFIWSQPDGRN